MNRTHYFIALAIIAVLIGGAYYLGTRQGSERQGRGATSTTTTSSKSAASQPADESTGFEVTTPLTEVLMKLQGTWQSDQDPRFTRAFALDKTTTDTYVAGQNTTTMQGDFVAFPGSDAPEGSLFPLNPKDMYITVTTKAGDVYHYRIVSLTDSKMTLAYLDQGSTLTYTKVR